MHACRHGSRNGFTLLEVVIVVVIIGIIAAIAIPRLSRGSSGAADSALSGNLAVLRNAIDLFSVEHGGAYPKLSTIEAQLTQYTNAVGTGTSATKDTTYCFGPYLRAVPTLPVGADKGKKTFVATYTAGNGWVYDENTGKISANCGAAEADGAGTKYVDY